MKRIETLELYPKLSVKLLQLLRNLSTTEWDTPSPIPGRKAKDLVSHLTDSSLRRLSIQRDKYQSTSVKVDISSYEDLVNYIQTLNKEWMHATERVSPKILMDLFEYAEDQLYSFFTTLDPEGDAIFPVQWAGEEKSTNWFDIAREYTEKWHHQMQIRMALNKPLILDTEYTEPLYDTFMLGLPHLFRDMKDYPIGETLQITISGKLNKDWILQRQGDGWVLLDDCNFEAKTKVQFSEEEAWKVFTNTDRNKEKYKEMLIIDGDKSLGYKLINLVTVLS